MECRIFSSDGLSQAFIISPSTTLKTHCAIMILLRIDLPTLDCVFFPSQPVEYPFAIFIMLNGVFMCIAHPKRANRLLERESYARSA